MNYNEKSGIVTEIIDKETIKVRVINEEEIRILKGNKFYISGLKDVFENEESESEGIVLVKFDQTTNVIIEDPEGGEF